MSIRLRALSIGCFKSGCLRLDGKKLLLEYAAVIEFKSQEDAMQFAQTVDLCRFKNYVVEKAHLAPSSEATK